MVREENANFLKIQAVKMVGRNQEGRGFFLFGTIKGLTSLRFFIIGGLIFSCIGSGGRELLTFASGFRFSWRTGLGGGCLGAGPPSGLIIVTELSDNGGPFLMCLLRGFRGSCGLLSFGRSFVRALALPWLNWLF